MTFEDGGGEHEKDSVAHETKQVGDTRERTPRSIVDAWIHVDGIGEETHVALPYPGAVATKRQGREDDVDHVAGTQDQQRAYQHRE